MRDIKERLELICEVSGSDIEIIISDISDCADRIINYDINSYFKYKDKYDLMDKIALSVINLIFRHYYLNGKVKWRSYSELMDKCVNYMQKNNDVNYLQIKFGKRFMFYGVALTDYKMRKLNESMILFAERRNYG